MAERDRGYLRGRKHKRDALQTQGKGTPSVLGPGALWQETPEWGHWLQAQRPRARGLHTKPQSYLASPFPFAFFSFCCMICVSLCLGDNRPSGSVLSLNRSALPFLILLAGKLLLVISCHGYCSDSALLYIIIFQIFEPYSCSPPRFSSVTAITFDHRDSPAFYPEASSLSSVQSLSRVLLFATPWTAAWQASLSITNSRCFHKRMSIELVMPSNHLILCHPLLLLTSVLPSIRVFSSESLLHMRWPKNWSFSFSISPSTEHPGLISFRMDWLDLLALQGSLKSLLQHHSSKATILQHLAFFTVQLSHPYMTTGKTIALTRWTFVGKVMSLLLNMHLGWS